MTEPNKALHPLLKRQIEKYHSTSDSSEMINGPFIQAVNDTYLSNDEERDLMERSLEISSEELLQRNSEIRAIFQAFPDIFLRIDLNGKILDYKKSSMVISYVIPAQLTGDYIQDIPIFRISPIFDNLIKQIKETDKLVTFENEMLCEGKKIYYEARVKSLLKNQAIIIIRDITENKIADEQKQFIENARLKTNFMSKVSHELRTPLTAMNEGIYLVFNEEVGKLNEQQKQLLSLVHRNLNRLSRLIDDVLYLQRMDSGKMEFIFKPTDINNVIMEVIETMCQSFVNKGLYLKSDLAAGLPKVKLDRDRIIQVVTNLINNAFKFTEQGGVLITSEATPQGVMIKVHDTGIGIRHEDVNRLFQSFEQLNTFERKSTGTGLGLVICKEILDHHGGKIWIESKYSKGSTFLFTLNAWQD